MKLLRLQYSAALFLFLLQVALASDSFFPDYKLTLNGGRIFFNSRAIDISKKAEEICISPRDKLDLGGNGYALLENDLGHFIVIAPHTRIKFLKSSFRDHTYIYLKEGSLLIENDLSETSDKIHVRTHRNLMSFSQGRYYISIWEGKEQLTVLNGSARYLNHLEFKIVFKGPQTITVDQKRKTISHFLPKKEALTILTTGNKLFKYSDLKFFNEFSSLIKKTVPHNPIPFEDFLPPKIVDYQLRVISPSPFIVVNDQIKTFSEEEQEHLTLSPGIHFFKWSNHTQSVLVKHFPQLVLSINDETPLKGFVSTERRRPSTFNLKKKEPKNDLQNNETTFEKLDSTEVRLSFNREPDSIKVVDIVKGFLIDQDNIEHTSNNNYVIKLGAGLYKLQIKKRGYKAEPVVFPLNISNPGTLKSNCLSLTIID